MRVRLDGVRRRPFRWDERREVDAEELGRSGIESLDPVTWQGEIRHIPAGFHLSATLGYDQRLRCDRCLVEVLDHVDATIELLVVGDDDALAEEVELTDADLGVLRAEGGELDLDDIFMEQLELNVPMKPLCRPTCRGLCVRCGADLNDGPCGCPAEPRDPRWEGLGEIRRQLSDE